LFAAAAIKIHVTASGTALLDGEVKPILFLTKGQG